MKLGLSSPTANVKVGCRDVGQARCLPYLHEPFKTRTGELLPLLSPKLASQTSLLRPCRTQRCKHPLYRCKPKPKPAPYGWFFWLRFLAGCSTASSRAYFPSSRVQPFRTCSVLRLINNWVPGWATSL